MAQFAQSTTMMIASVLLIAAAMLSPSNSIPSPFVRNLRGRRPRLRCLQQQNQLFCPQCTWAGNIVCEARANFLVDNYGDLTLEEAREEISDVCSSEDGLPPDDGNPPVIPLDFFCGKCPWSSMNFNCDSRVAYIEENYFLSTQQAQQDLMEAGECIDPSYVAPNDASPEPDGDVDLAGEPDSNSPAPEAVDIVLFCGACAWRESGMTCDEKARSLDYGDMTLEQAKISILPDCFQDQDRLVAEEEPEKTVSVWAIVVIVAVVLLVLILCILFAKQRKRRLKEEEEERSIYSSRSREERAAHVKRDLTSIAPTVADTIIMEAPKHAVPEDVSLAREDVSVARSVDPVGLDDDEVMSKPDPPPEDHFMGVCVQCGSGAHVRQEMHVCEPGGDCHVIGAGGKVPLVTLAPTPTMMVARNKKSPRNAAVSGRARADTPTITDVASREGDSVATDETTGSVSGGGTEGSENSAPPTTSTDAEGAGATAPEADASDKAADQDWDHMTEDQLRRNAENLVRRVSGMSTIVEVSLDDEESSDDDERSSDGDEGPSDNVKGPPNIAAGPAAYGLGNGRGTSNPQDAKSHDGRSIASEETRKSV